MVDGAEGLGTMVGLSHLVLDEVVLEVAAILGDEIDHSKCTAMWKRIEINNSIILFLASNKWV